MHQRKRRWVEGNLQPSWMTHTVRVVSARAVQFNLSLKPVDAPIKNIISSRISTNRLKHQTSCHLHSGQLHLSHQVGRQVWHKPYCNNLHRSVFLFSNIQWPEFHCEI